MDKHRTQENFFNKFVEKDDRLLLRELDIHAKIKKHIREMFRKKFVLPEGTTAYRKSLLLSGGSTP